MLATNKAALVIQAINLNIMLNMTQHKQLFDRVKQGKVGFAKNKKNHKKKLISFALAVCWLMQCQCLHQWMLRVIFTNVCHSHHHHHQRHHRHYCCYNLLHDYWVEHPNPICPGTFTNGFALPAGARSRLWFDYDFYYFVFILFFCCLLYNIFWKKLYMHCADHKHIKCQLISSMHKNNKCWYTNTFLLRIAYGD